MPGNSFECPFFTKFRKVEEETTEGTEWQWFSWQKLKAEEGEDVAMEMVSNGSLVSRPHKNLGPDTKLKWPATHEFKKTQERGSSLKRKTEGTKDTCTPF